MNLESLRTLLISKELGTMRGFPAGVAGWRAKNELGETW